MIGDSTASIGSGDNSLVISNAGSDASTSLFNAVMQPDTATTSQPERVSFIMPRLAPHPSPWGDSGSGAGNGGGTIDIPPVLNPPQSGPFAPGSGSPLGGTGTPWNPGGGPLVPGGNSPGPFGDSGLGNSNGGSSGGRWGDSGLGNPGGNNSGGRWGDGGLGKPGDSGAGQPTDNPNPLPGGQTAADAVAALKEDQVTRTEYSFENGVDKFKTLGKENEVALELQMRDWLNKQNTMNPITFMRGTALIADGLGQFRLDEGSRIDLTSHQDTKPRILKGYDYDFGGEATTFLRLSAGSLVQAQQYVIGHKGLVIDGQPMDDAYMQQLKNLQTGVESNLNRIYGPHDVDGVFNTLVNEVRVNSGDWQQGLVRLHQQLDGTKSSDNRFMAKSARDVALGFMAEAAYMSSRDNGEEAKIMYTTANQYIAMSQRLDGSAPDNVALQNIYTKLGPQINKAIDNQWNDPFSNPFGIPKPRTVIA